MIQPIIRRGTRSNATARRLIAATTIAPHVLRETIEDSNVTKPVQPCKATETGMLAGVPLFAGQKFYLVQSRFAGRCYVVTQNERNGEWTCSSKDAKRLCLDKVHIYLAARKWVAA